MDDQPEDPIAALWAAWDVLRDQHGRPSAGKIARWSAKTAQVATLPESTIRGWMKPPHTTVPDWNDGFRVLLQYIDSATSDDVRKGPREQDKPYWRDLWLKADDKRKARLAGSRSDAREDATSSDPNAKQPPTDSAQPAAGDAVFPPSDPTGPPANKPSNNASPPSPPAPPEPITDASTEKDVKASLVAKLRAVQIKPWKIIVVAGIATVCVLAIIYWIIGRGENITKANGVQPTEGPASVPTEAGSRSPTPDPPGTRYCAFVIKEPAAVYPKPDVRAKEIKFKPLNFRIEVFPDREHPPGWIVVHTPKDPPGSNWMQSTVLTEPAPCVPPLPGG